MFKEQHFFLNNTFNIIIMACKSLCVFVILSYVHSEVLHMGVHRTVGWDGTPGLGTVTMLLDILRGLGQMGILYPRPSQYWTTLTRLG